MSSLTRAFKRGACFGGPLAIFLIASWSFGTESSSRSCISAETFLPPRVQGTNPSPSPHVESVDASENFQKGPGFLWVSDQVGEIGCVPGAVGKATLVRWVTDVLTEAQVDPELAVVLSTEPASCSSIYYVPVSNGVRGIGYSHIEPEEVFDQSPESSLEGVVFLNDFPYWQEHFPEYRSAFLHEIAHRMSGRVHAQAGDMEFDLTGREQAHWSYFVDTDSSPLEGNDYSETGETTTVKHPLRYSPLDLYLMGALKAAEVPDFSFFPSGQADGPDCKGAQVTPSSPPQTCGATTIEGERIDLRLDDVIQVEGQRDPSLEGNRKVAFLLVGQRSFDLETCGKLRDAIQGNLLDYQEATRGRLELENIIDGGNCEELNFRRVGGETGCGFAARPSRPSPIFWIAFLAILLLGHRGPRGHSVD